VEEVEAAVAEEEKKIIHRREAADLVPSIFYVVCSALA